MWLSPSGQVAHTTLDWRLCRTRIFKMAGEILKTVVSHTIEELSILGAVIVLRALLTFLIHWELKMERQTEHAEREHAKIHEKAK